jgi:hypothetical protein
MNLSQIKKHLNKIRIISWFDPQSQHRTNLDDMIKTGFCKCESIGKIVHIQKNLIIIEHEKADELGDYTNLHSSLIYKIKKIR